MVREVMVGAQDQSTQERTPFVSSQLATALLAEGHSVRLRAEGRSMRPFLRPRTIVTVEPVTDPSRLRVGDVAFILSGGRPMLHRVVRAAPRLVTKGDARPCFDPSPEAVLGRVVGSGGGAGRAIALLSRLGQPVQYYCVVAACLSRRLLSRGSGRAC